MEPASEMNLYKVESTNTMFRLLNASDWLRDNETQEIFLGKIVNPYIKSMEALRDIWAI